MVGHLVCSKPYVSTPKHLRNQHECAYLLAKDCPAAPASPIGDVLKWLYTGNKLHPTQKPLSVLLLLVETAPQGTVFDPFAGSGSSLLAAQQLGRSYLDIELDSSYHAIATQRLAAQ